MMSRHPARGHGDDAPRVLIIAEDKATFLELERALPATVTRRSVGGAAETEGLGADVVVIATPFPLAELVEVRAHPHLSDRPVVLFAPNKDLPVMDWPSMSVFPVVTDQDPIGQFVDHVRCLLDVDAPSRHEAELAQ